MRYGRIFILMLGVLGAAGVGRMTAESLQPDEIYRKDFISPYLMARAIAVGDDPYKPLSTLIAQYLPEAPPSPFNFQTPHTPALGLLCLPLTLLSYRNAAILWLVLQASLLLVCALLIRSILAPRSSWLTACVIAAICLLSRMMMQELWLGQINLLLLALFCGAWIDLREGGEARGGLWLGLILALKFMAWPALIFLALRRRWRALIAAGAVFIAANLLACVLIGAGKVQDYYLTAGPTAAAIFRKHDQNFSAHAVGRRPFEGVGPGAWVGLASPPLWPSSTLAMMGGILAPLTVLIWGLWLACRAKDFDVSFGVLVCTSLLVAPITWWHYLILAAIPLTIVVARLHDARFPLRLSVVCFVVGGLMLAPNTLFLQFAGDTTSPFMGFILTSLPALIPLALAWLLVNGQGREVAARARTPALACVELKK